MPTKEQVCQEKLRPLLIEIEKICNEHEINCIAQFILDVSPDDPKEHRTCTLIVGGNKTDEIAMRKLTIGAFQMLGPEGIAKFVSEMGGEPELVDGGVEIELGRITNNVGTASPSGDPDAN